MEWNGCLINVIMWFTKQNKFKNHLELFSPAFLFLSAQGEIDLKLQK